jgi:DNA-binding response OmpR family regulator
MRPAAGVPALVVLVQGDKKALGQLDARLSARGYLVAPASSVRRAKRLLESVIPDLLITSIELRGASGFELAELATRDHPRLPVILTHPTADAQMERRVRECGLSLVAGPPNEPALLAAAAGAIRESRPLESLIRRSPRKRVSVEHARLGSDPARLVDVSYDGVRLEMERPATESLFSVTLPGTGLTLKAERMWTGPAPGLREHWCGARLVEPDTAKRERWREFVDSLAEAGARADAPRRGTRHPPFTT